jgi:hypothetical protein
MVAGLRPGIEQDAFRGVAALDAAALALDGDPSFRHQLQAKGVEAVLGGEDARCQATGVVACQDCAIKQDCTTSKMRRITRWEHEHILEAVQRRLDENPQAMRQRRETVEHPFGTIKARMGATHFLMKRLKNVRSEMALSVLAYNLTRVMNILGIAPLLKAMSA